MTFDGRERSPDLGNPLEIYDFAVGAVHYRYTSADHEVTFGAEVFESVQIERSEFEETEELEKSDISVTIPHDLLIADEFRIAPPSNVVGLTIYRLHADDPDAERAAIWTGRVLNGSFEKTSCKLHCESVFTALQRMTQRRKFGRLCPYETYGVECLVNELDFKTETTVFLIDGPVITANAGDLAVLGDGYFSGGFVQLETSPGIIVRRGIKSQTGDELTLTHLIPGLTPGTVIEVYAGDDHSFETCRDKFLNGPRFGGFKDAPTDNPFAGKRL